MNRVRGDILKTRFIFYLNVLFQMQSTTKKWIYWVSGTLLGIFILLATSISLIPTFIKYYSSSWLEQQGLHGAIEDVTLRLARGKIIVKNVSISRKDKEVLKLGELALQIRPKDILDNKITIESVKVNSLNLLAKQEANSFIFAGISLGNDEKEKAASGNHSTTQWTISIQDIELSDIHSCFEQNTSKQKTILYLCQSTGSLYWKGQAQYMTMLPLSKALTAKGELTITDLTVVDRKNDRLLMTFSNLNMEKINIPSIESINIQNIVLKDFKALREGSNKDKGLHSVQWKEFSVHKFDLLKKNNLKIDRALLSGLAGTLKISESGKPAAIEDIQNLLPESKSTKKQEENSAFTVQVQQASVDTEDTITIIDNSVLPPATHRLGKLHLNVKNIDSTDKSNFSPVDAELKVGDYGSVKISGKAQFFADKATLYTDAKIKALNLAELSDYSNKLLNYKIKSGQLDADLKINIKEGKLDSNATLYLHKFYLEKSDEKSVAREQKELGMPLSSALSLLRGKDDSIKLKLPVTGDLKNPDFSINDAINTVTLKALKQTIINYYVSFGLVPLLEKSYDLATALRFEPVRFDAANSELDNADRQQLDKLAQLLNEKPGVHLVICGHVTRDDRFNLFPMEQEWFIEKSASVDTGDDDTETTTKAPPLPSLSDRQIEKLVDLARKRGEKVKEYLVNKKGIGGDRLILCNPVYNPEDTEPPYTEIKI